MAGVKVKLPAWGASRSSSKLPTLPSADRFKHVINAPNKYKDEEEWSRLRRLCKSAIASQHFDLLLGVVIIFNMLLLILEADVTAKPISGPGEPDIPTPESEPWMAAANHILAGFYCVELSLRVFVYRSRFFRSWRDWLDLGIVGSEVFLQVVQYAFSNVPHVAFLRMFRLLRLGRGVKMLGMFPQLSIMLKGLAGAFSAIFWGGVLLFTMLLMWAILAVQVIHPLNVKLARDSVFENLGCDRCPRSFSSVYMSLLTFTQHYISGDSWGNVSVPLAEEYPATMIFFGGVIVTVNLAILNLMLAVIVDCANEARRNSDEQLALEKEKEYQRIKKKLVQHCKQLDTDRSGTLSLEEISQGYYDNTDFGNAMRAMDIYDQEIETLCNILDEDKSGHVNYEEFVEQLHKMKTNDSHTMLVFIKYYVMEIRTQILEQVELLKQRLDGKASDAHEANTNTTNPSHWKLGAAVVAAQSISKGEPSAKQHMEQTTRECLEGFKRNLERIEGYMSLLAGSNGSTHVSTHGGTLTSGSTHVSTHGGTLTSESTPCREAQEPEVMLADVCLLDENCISNKKVIDSLRPGEQAAYLSTNKPQVRLPVSSVGDRVADLDGML